MRPTTNRRSAVAAVLSSLLARPVRAATEAVGIPALLDGAFRPLLARHDVPGLAVGVTVRGQRHVACYGVASRDGGHPVTERTLFEIGSLGKTFTATLGGLAQALGRLSLHDHPGRHLPQLRGSAIDRATLLHLGTYTAGGLPLQFPDAVTPENVLAYFRAWTPAAAPGRQRRYSNPSIGLFGQLAALALGRDFAQLVQADLFPRLGLAHTHVQVPDAAMPDYAWGYGKTGQPLRVHPGVFAAQAYGVKSTVGDMLRFVEANLQPQLLDAPLRQAIEITQAGYFRVGGMVQGLGWEQYPDPVPLDRLLAGNSAEMALAPHAATPMTQPHRPTVPTLFNKTGSTNGFGAYAVFVPARQVGLVMLANRNIPIEARIRAAHAVLEGVAARA